ncbi:hypothetical protein [Corynebacterium marinum]|uniref:Uncharacterized protein n=1 Tax=Corynebacterium marinum DSM 44953 TaxID=1224162 RepID=A0A0B6TF11_9CORY|nr:hypothetical protein [Corynebacterium marinum]AJK68587.1 hypothetical protein B840_04840 [Corynebacterium marinum DSM 44953]GGO14517.1 hypothetical protein GCM10010980_08970 [Corynebacterium marinum]
MIGPFKKSVEQRSSGWLKAGHWANEWWPRVALGLVTIAAIVISAFPSWKISFFGCELFARHILALLSALLLIIGGIGSIKHGKSLAEAESNKALYKDLANSYRNDVHEILKFSLTKLVAECDLLDGDYCKSDVRVTLYCHDKERRDFIPAARISGNPLFEEQGRDRYPDDIGIISLGWQKGVASLQSNAKTSDEWIQEQEEEWNLPRETAEKISMQSKSMVAVKLVHHGNAIGVAVAESTTKSRVPARLHKQIKEAEWFDPVARLLTTVRPSLLPHISKGP